MSNTELLIKEIETLPVACVTEVLDFVGYIKQKHSQAAEAPNPVTIAAMQEVQDMIDGKIPAATYQSIDEMLEALHN